MLYLVYDFNNKQIAVNNTSSQSYRVSLSIRDHIVLTATQGALQKLHCEGPQRFDRQRLPIKGCPSSLYEFDGGCVESWRKTHSSCTFVKCSFILC